MLCLNQDGYTAKIPYNQRVFNELERFNYLIPLDDGLYMFLDVPDVGQDDVILSPDMKRLFSLYGVSDAMTLHVNPTCHGADSAATVAPG